MLKKNSALYILFLMLFFIVNNAQANSEKPLQLHFFYTPSCPICEPTKQVVAQIEDKYGDRIEVIRHNHSESEAAFTSLILALEYYNREDTPSLTVFSW